MTIAKNQPWGWSAPLGRDAPVVSSERDLNSLINTGATSIGVLGGDLCRTLGGTGNRDHLYGPDAMTLPCDVLHITLDGHKTLAVAHVIVRNSWFRGPLVAIMNAQYLGQWDVAPRSHPNDGLADVFDVTSMPIGQRLKARRRLPSGTHVPHPLISQHRVKDWERPLAKPTKVWVDGIAQGRVQHIAITVQPDAITVTV